MKGKQFLVGFAVLALTASSGAVANEIYKWTDEDGNVHYEDRPSGATNAERLALSYNRTDASSVNKRVDAYTEATAARREARAAADVEAQKAEEALAQAEADKKKCESYRSQLETMLQAPRVYRETGDGERHYLDDQERQEARTRAEEMIAEYCNS